ncbi:MAG: bifunctional oligoribonuclease and phosphatase NrnA [Pseudothermotoga sp.]|nr:bifunctional oligoribonuclease and phosphatase NrnA [Pseudothermotoga sp.]
MKFSSIISQINESKFILVIGHIMPDGDDISSVTSLAVGLERLGKTVVGSIDYPVPWYYRNFYGVEKLKTYEQAKDLDPDLIIVVDCSTPDRVGRFQNLLNDRKTIVIDHHATNTLFGGLNWVDSSSASTAQMVYILNKTLGVPYDADLATVNYLGIATDTGFFKYSNTDSHVFKIAAELVEFGAKPHFVSSTILENKSPEQMKLYCRMVDHMIVDGQLVYSWLSYDDYRANNCSDDDSTGFVSELRSIKNVEVAILFIEYPEGQVHVSMRSKNWVDVSKIASSLGGGGHARAAGCSFRDAKLHEVLDEVIGLVRDFLQGGNR